MDNRQRSAIPPGSTSAGQFAKPKWRPSEKEFTLRCHCPACRRMIIVPLTILGTDEVCPACSQRVRIPTLDRQVTGLDIVRRFLSAEPTPPPVAQSQLDDFADDVHAPRAGAATQSSGTRHSPDDYRRDDEPRGSASSRHGPPPLPDSHPRETRWRDSDNDKDGYGSFGEFATDAGSLVKGATARLTDFVSSVSGGLFRSPRRVRYALFYGIWLGPMVLLVLIDIVVGIAEGPQAAVTLFCVFVFVGIQWWFIGNLLARWLPPLILAFLFPTVRCPFCQDDIPMYGLWNCGCGYHDHRERHLLRMRCPKCGERSGHINCPRCDATILL